MDLLNMDLINMDRRTFSKTLAGAATLAATAGRSASAPDQNAPPFQLSVMLWTVFRNLPFGQRLEKCIEAGYKNVELVGEYGKWSEDEFSRNVAKARELGVFFDTTAGLKHAVANPNDRDAFLADLQRELPIMERLNCPAVIVMSGNATPGMPRQIQHDSCIEGLKRAAALVEGKQIAGQPVRLLLENIDPEENPKYYLTSVAEGFEIVKAVNHPQVQFLYDFFHEQIAEGNLIEKLEKNIQHTGLVHIADVPGRHQPGTGEINYENIYRKLAELKYNRIAAMEFIPTGGPVEQLRLARETVFRCIA
jgi:hydroxypyruvate isomerase